MEWGWGVNPERRESLVWRSKVAVVVVGLFGAIIVGKTFCETVPLREDRLRREKGILPRADSIPGAPGTIYTADGEVLARAVVRYAICANPRSYGTSAERDRAARGLAAMTKRTYPWVMERLKDPKKGFCYIVRQVEPDLEEKIADLKLPGVYSRPEIGRVYPFGRMASNALGLRGVDGKGLCGIELLWGFAVDGKPSTQRENFDPYGRLILAPGPTYMPPEPGKRLVLTIRRRLQQVADAAIEQVWTHNKPVTTTCTVMDPRTGNILAIASRPNFNPNDSSTAEQGTTRCHQAADGYDPGSTWKSAVIAAALDAGVITPESRFYCGGTTEIGGKPLGCWGKYRTQGHGSIATPDVIARSCNLAAAQIAAKLGKDRLYDYLARMHITDTMSSGLIGECAGLVPPVETARVRDIANIGFGQSITVTDLHVLAVYGAIANGGMFYYPNIVKEVREPDGSLFDRREPVEGGRLFKSQTCREMRGFLERAVASASGTGQAAAIPGFRIGGKTGTAQIVDHEHGGFLEDEYVLSFAAIAPVDDPQFVVLVRVTQPEIGQHGSDTALPAAKRVIEAALRLADDIDA